jgi:predicted RNase H-like HicB family nuclease
MKVRQFSLRRYVERALQLAEYERDEGGVVVARVPDADGFYAQGGSVEEARSDLAEVVEGNVLLALQLGLEVPEVPGFAVVEQDVAQAFPFANAVAHA